MGIPQFQNELSDSRYIPATIKRAVWDRDNGQCTFTRSGRRCTERGFLEFHHRIPYAHQGPTSIANLTLHCKSHNRAEADAAGLARYP